jgi:competence protein ComGC
MKPRIAHRQTAAMTRVELVAVVFVIAVLLVMVLPALNASRRRGSYISCASVVKQVVLDFRVWANDNHDKFPMEISVANGGTMELAATGDVVATFQIMSNELSTPKVLFCPYDTKRSYATNFSVGFSSKNISYFIGIDAKTNSPQAFLCGDDNFAISGVPVKSGLLNLESSAPVTWTAARHHFTGNIGLFDGLVNIVASSGLTNLLQQTGLATNRLAIP